MRFFQYILGIVILVVILFKIDLTSAVDIMKNINLPLLIAISLITIPQIFMKSLRWRYLLNLQGIKYTVSQSFVTYSKGIYFGMITPGRVGELIKVVYLRNEKSTEIGEGFSNVLLDRFIDIYALAAISAFSCMRFAITQPFVWLFIGFIVLFIPFMVFAFKVEKIRRVLRNIFDRIFPQGGNNVLREQIESFYYGFKKIPVKSIVLTFGFTLLIYSVFFVQCYFLSKLVAINLSFANIVFASAIASLVAAMPISALGLGTRDATLIYFFGRVGVSAPEAIVYSFLMLFAFYLIGAVVGFISWNVRLKNVETDTL